MSEQEQPAKDKKEEEKGNTGDIKPPTKGETEPPEEGEPQGRTTTA